MLSQDFYLSGGFDPSTIDWSSYEPNHLTPEQEEVTKMSALIEYAALPSTLSMLKDIPEDNQQLRSIIIRWAYDETKHSYIFNEYCRRFIPNHTATEYEYKEIGKDFDNVPMSVPAILTMHMCGEISTIRWYKKMHSWHTEPLMQKLLSEVSKDEAKHANYFKKYLIENLKPEEVKDVLAAFQLYLSKRVFLTIKLASTGNSSIESRLPNPSLFDKFFKEIISYSDEDQQTLHKKLLNIASQIVGVKFNTVKELKDYRKSL
jgi:hypothetical protein